jgi:hypothetical protein
MAIDWDRVAKQHVVQACHLLDSGEARPTRPAQSTFLIVKANAIPQSLSGDWHIDLPPDANCAPTNTAAARRRFASSGRST